MLAQQLYEAGYISYMRTDSVNLSQDSLSTAKSFIDSSFGKIILWTNPPIQKQSQRSARSPRSRPTDSSVQNVRLNERPA